MSNYPGQADPLDPAAAATEAIVEAEAQAQGQAEDRAGIEASGDEQAAHRAKRLRRIKLSIISSLLIRPLSVIVPLVTIPLFLNYLGQERYGLYETIAALALYLGMTNVGLTMGLINQLTDCDVRGDRAMARRYVSTITVAMLVFTIVSLVLVTALAVGVNWQAVLDVQSPRAQRETPWAFWWAGVCVISGLLVGTAPAVYLAYQENHRNNIWDGIGRVLSLAAAVGVTQTEWGVAGVIIALTGVPSAVRMLNLLTLFFYEKPWLRPTWRDFSLPLLGTMARHGVLLFVLQTAAILLFQTDKLIIGVALSPADVTGYAILGRVFLIGYGLYMMLLTPLWPASGEAIRRGDLAWIRRSMRFSILLGCGMTLCGGLVLLVGGNWLLGRLPGGEGLTVSRSLILAVTAAFITRAWVDGRSIVLLSSNVLVPQLFIYGGHAVLNVILSIVLVQHYGVEGVAWATPITALFTSVWGYPWMIRRYILNPQRKKEA